MYTYTQKSKDDIDTHMNTHTHAHTHTHSHTHTHTHTHTHIHTHTRMPRSVKKMQRPRRVVPNGQTTRQTFWSTSGNAEPPLEVSCAISFVRPIAMGV